ncbi:MAG TPA: exodeoxyribonuclease VII large subunit, partial [Tepidiformaceae bacterium]|nr:exodeoxyribonuclease VII large subunit [Tepidiformaceae bacterium]
MQALTVSAAVGFLREVLEANEFFSDMWLAGEVSNYTRSQAGHRYFSLKDPGATIRSVLFASAMPGVELEPGARVLAHGRITVYPQRGDLQFVCDFVRPEGVGILAARFEQLRERLEAEGLFAPERKRPLPRFPMRIGVVTSPTGAAYQDIQDVLRRRWPMATVVFAPALVQGEQAAGQVVAAMRALAETPGLDVAIVARGGGSAEDLAAFNEEQVARAIFGFPAPVVTGVGHETDVTIADLVADMRAPTPSAAAERATPDVRDVARGIVVLERAMWSATRGGVREDAARVEQVLSRLRRAGPDTERLDSELEALVRRMGGVVGREVALQSAKADEIVGRLQTLDP